MKVLSRVLLLVLLLTALYPFAALAKKNENLAPLSLKNARMDIRDALMIAARKAEIDIVIGKDVDGEISVELSQVPAKKALEIMSMACGCVLHEFDRKNGVFLVVPMKQAKSLLRFKSMKGRFARRRKLGRGARRRGQKPPIPMGRPASPNNPPRGYGSDDLPHHSEEDEQ